ncbi:Asp-tRNA(Asn)/Glu-tRNA(Gln) amidotransferase GatCAB subunit A, partial [Candidatus Pacearchaeota archaeon]|nr:Asp-tRNA(Asn)/Glu-tRNA(Gln) amidotransferase GatCAB subunit A [Candidatus Pacearchaeota archaeon]
IEKLNKLRIGIPKLNIQDKRISQLIMKKVKDIADKKGGQVKNIELKHIDLAVQAYYPICYVEFFSGTRRFDGRRYGKKIEDACGPEVLRRILGGSEISKAEFKGLYYRRALKAKQLIKQEFESAFKDVDCIIMPAVPRLPHRLGSKISVEEMYGYDALTIPANLAEIPALSIPAGKIDNVPVGMQIMCSKFEEAKMLSIAEQFEI